MAEEAPDRFAATPDDFEFHDAEPETKATEAAAVSEALADAPGNPWDWRGYP